MRHLGPAFAGLLLLLPIVAASHQPGHPVQPMQVFVESPRGLQSPLSGHATTNITVRLDCTLAQSDAPINFTVRGVPNWLYVSSMPGWRTTRNNFTGYSGAPCDAETGYVTVKAPMRMNFTSFAPAYRVTNFTVVAKRADDVKETRGWIQPGYYGTLQVSGPDRIARISAQETKATLQYRVRNLGNGETTVRLNYEAPDGIRVDGPDILNVGANPQGGDWDRPLNVVIFLDEVKDSSFRVKVNATGFSRNASDPRPASSSEAFATVDIQRGTPAAPLALVAAAGLAAALAIGRSRKGRA